MSLGQFAIDFKGHSRSAPERSAHVLGDGKVNLGIKSLSAELIDLPRPLLIPGGLSGRSSAGGIRIRTDKSPSLVESIILRHRPHSRPFGARVLPTDSSDDSDFGRIAAMKALAQSRGGCEGYVRLIYHSVHKVNTTKGLAGTDARFVE